MVTCKIKHLTNIFILHHNRCLSLHISANWNPQAYRSGTPLFVVCREQISFNYILVVVGLYLARQLVTDSILIPNIIPRPHPHPFLVVQPVGCD